MGRKGEEIEWKSKEIDICRGAYYARRKYRIKLL